MDIIKEKAIIIDHWDNMFKERAFNLKEAEKIDPDTTLNKAIIKMASKAHRILDIGTGSGYALFTAKYYGKAFREGIGIDPSKHAIQSLKKICKDGGLDDLNFIQGDHTALDQFEDASFDGIICSNVLDVLPKPLSFSIIASIKRLLKKDGELVLKLNFYLTEPLIEKLKMERVEENTYKMNNVIRGLNFTSEEWIEFFKPLQLIKTDSYERVKDGPKDRIFVFKK